MSRLRSTALVLLPCLAAACGTMSTGEKSTLMVGGGVLAATGVVIMANNSGEPDSYDEDPLEDSFQAAGGMMMAIGGGLLMLAAAMTPVTAEAPAGGQAQLDRCLSWQSLRDAEPDPARRAALDAGRPGECGGAPGQRTAVATRPADLESDPAFLTGRAAACEAWQRAYAAETDRSRKADLLRGRLRNCLPPDADGAAPAVR